MVDALAQRYGKLPTEILELTPEEFYLNLTIGFPEAIRERRDRAERQVRETKLGYNPIQKLLEAAQPNG
jgi:hypothetical protein